MDNVSLYNYRVDGRPSPLLWDAAGRDVRAAAAVPTHRTLALRLARRIKRAYIQMTVRIPPRPRNRTGEWHTTEGLQSPTKIVTSSRNTTHSDTRVLWRRWACKRGEVFCGPTPFLPISASNHAAQHKNNLQNQRKNDTIRPLVQISEYVLLTYRLMGNNIFLLVGTTARGGTGGRCK